MKLRMKSRRRIWLRRVGWLLGLGFAVVAAALGFYRSAALRVLEEEIRETPRNPATGVVIGCEAITLYAADVNGPAASVGVEPKRSQRAALLIHGFVASRRDFSGVGGRIAAAGWDVRLMRAPGHGTKPSDLVDETAASLYEGVRSEYEALAEAYDEVAVVGHSMGGALATLLASREPVDRLVLIAPYYGVAYHPCLILPAEWWNGLLRPVLPYVSKPRGPGEGAYDPEGPWPYFYRAVPTDGVAALMDLGREARREENLRFVECPALLLMSENDLVASPGRARKAFEALGSEEKKAVWLTESNHLLLWEQEQEKVKEEIVSFLE